MISPLRASYDEITRGYHMNKEHWNTVYLDGNLANDFIRELIDISYDLVANLWVKKRAKKEI